MDDEDTISLDDELELLVEAPKRSVSTTKPPPIPASARRMARGSERAITAN